jgi:hypothetical protein
MILSSALFTRLAPLAVDLPRRMRKSLERLCAQEGSAPRVYLAEVRRAREAERRFSELRARDSQALAREGMTYEGIPRRLFEEFFARKMRP